MVNDLISTLYSFAMGRDMGTRYIPDLPAYQDSKRVSEQAGERLLPLLDAAAKKELDLFWDERLTCEGMERESIFAAGLSVGLSLSRLG